ncbi:uncharacterized protein LOC143422360 [Xylocopa sonorina]|uniref:uncharacterized protein LOC143422360 n=1 Tax=Xylocopa sonorina TaxID=1818115 RepID=UPI00403A80C2
MNEIKRIDPVTLDDLLRKVVKNLGMKFEDTRYSITNGNQAFLSNMLFVNIIPNANDENENEKKKAISLVVKMRSFNELSNYMSLDEQFHNEILFYTKYAKGDEEFARCVYVEEKPQNSVIVLENVIAERGYYIADYKYNIPLEYTYAALRDMAKFHAKAYAMKEQRREEFFDIVRSIQECWLSLTCDVMIVRHACKSKGTNYLRKTGGSDPFLDKFHDLLEHSYNEMFKKLIEPEEPLATLCHGDLSILNMLFKRENGKLSTMFIDFAMIVYSTPIVDVSMFLSLHCMSYFSKNLLNDSLKVYHERLTECLKENGVDCSKYSYEAFNREYKRKGLYGYTIASYFLGILMKEEHEWSPATSKESDVRICAEMTRLAGGEKVNKLLGDQLLVLREFGCLDDFVQPDDSINDS